MSVEFHVLTIYLLIYVLLLFVFSVLSPGNGQYLKKELLGSAILDFCHPTDLQAFKQHLKESKFIL